MRICAWISDVCSSDLIAADRFHRGENRERVRHPMRARLCDGETEQRILHLRRDQRPALAVGEPVDRADIGALAEPEADDMRRMFFRLGAQPRVMGAVERDDGGAAGFEPFENLALGVCYGVFAAEIFQMRGGYGDRKSVV